MDIKDVKLEFLGHSGFLIVSNDGKRIVIDPYNVSEGLEKADFIFISHGHSDHCSIKDIMKLSKPGTIVVTSPDVQSKITKVDDVELQIVEVGDEVSFGDFKVEIFPAYNVEKDFHPKSEGWLGFVFKIGEAIIYHTGDSDKIPEMQRLTGYGKRENEFVALLPVSGVYVMDVDEAVEVASFLSPDLVIPMHYGAGVAGSLEDAQRFVKLCEEKNLRAKILEKI
ncbi:Zn-dependent hydrolase [Candidatus Pacearchaeota archaeon CG10_big_fil_rev_8_21_14_0_10_31_24]|nr:MAG: Zn-dependent hydrolase [Candidatus Pacearchaeota archaeon CG10_big_fil_rev_8_21_14_0_10_31_24]